MNFSISDDELKYRTDVTLAELNAAKPFSDKLKMFFLELPHFQKKEDDCLTNFERWIYTLKHMEALTRLPFTTQKQIFLKLADVADIEKMEEPMRARYEESLKEYRDYLSVQKAAKAEGIEEGLVIGEAKGRAQGRAEGEIRKAVDVAKKMLSRGSDTEFIIECTGLSVDEIERLK